jgi:hypothetical protein
MPEWACRWGRRDDGVVTDELDPEAVVEIDLTAAQQVAADEAMLLDLGGAEEVADLIARQSLGEADSVADARPVPAED